MPEVRLIGGRGGLGCAVGVKGWGCGESSKKEGKVGREAG